MSLLEKHTDNIFYKRRTKYMNELVLCLLSGGVAAGLVKIAESFMT